VCKGSRNSAVKDADVTRLKQYFAFAEVKQWKKVGDGMPSNREEMLPIMQFIARRLVYEAQTNLGDGSHSIEI
jgi:hypothetical protein